MNSKDVYYSPFEQIHRDILKPTIHDHFSFLKFNQIYINGQINLKDFF